MTGVWISLAAFAASAAFLYVSTIAGLVRGWWTDPDYAHALLVIPFALFLVWRRRRALSDLSPEPRGAGLMVAVAGLGVFALGSMAMEPFLTRLSLVIVIAGSVIFLLGWRPLRIVALPLLLVASTIPLPAIVANQITLPLQFVASTAAEWGVAIVGVPLLREGNVLVLPNATLQVSEACSGIRSLMALVTITAIVATSVRRGAGTRMLIVLSAIPIAVFVNAVRVAVTALAAYWWGIEAARGTPHEMTGAVLFIVACAMVIAFARSLGSVGLVPPAQVRG
jgi:exosortase